MRKLLYASFIALFFIIGCASQPKPADVPISQAVKVVEPPPVVVEKPVPVPVAGQLKKIPENSPAAKLSDPVNQSMQSARIKPPDVPEGYLNAITQYTYMEGALYQLYTAPGFVSDIILKPGENLLSPPAAGDTVRWVVNVAKSGSSAGERNHILIKPIYPDLTTNIMIYTDQHTYFIEALSYNGKSYMAAVSWLYPMEELKLPLGLSVASSKGTSVDTSNVIVASMDPTKLNFSYEISGANPKWKPVRSFDDGSKTYIEFPQDLLRWEAPVLFIVSHNNELQLCNYRVKGVFYVVDRLFESAELRMGDKNQVIVKIKKV